MRRDNGVPRVNEILTLTAARKPLRRADLDVECFLAGAVARSHEQARYECERGRILRETAWVRLEVQAPNDRSHVRKANGREVPSSGDHAQQDSYLAAVAPQAPIPWRRPP